MMMSFGRSLSFVLLLVSFTFNSAFLSCSSPRKGLDVGRSSCIVYNQVLALPGRRSSTESIALLMAGDDSGVNSSSSSSNTSNNDGAIEVGEIDNDKTPAASTSEPVAAKVVAPFISQGELAEGVLNPDFSDPKQTRVVLYIIISLVPVLFLIPLILGSRDLIPLED